MNEVRVRIIRVKTRKKVKSNVITIKKIDYTEKSCFIKHFEKKKDYDERRKEREAKEMNKDDKKDRKNSNKKKLNNLKFNLKVNFLLIIIYAITVITENS